MTRLALSAALALGLLGCDGADPPDDAGLDGGSEVDAGTEADAGVVAPGEVIGEEVLAFDLSPDGARLAWIGSVDGDRAVWLRELATDQTTRFDEAGDADAIRFSPDGAWILWERGGGTSRIRDVAQAAAAVVLTEDVIATHRFILVDPTGTPQLRLVSVLAPDGSATARATARTDADGFASEIELAMLPALTSDLSLISGSRDTVLFRVEGATDQLYYRAATDGSEVAQLLPIDAETVRFGPVGMGNTHGVATTAGGGLSFVEFATGTTTELAPDGIDPFPTLFDITDGGRYVYYLRDGDLSRRLRDGSAAEETLLNSAATDWYLTPDGARLVYEVDATTRSIPVGGGTETRLAPFVGEGTPAFSPDGAEVALVTGTQTELYRLPTDAEDATELVESGRRLSAPFPSFDHAGRLLWTLEEDEEGRRRALRTGSPPRTIAWGAMRWEILPGTDDVLYLDGGTLRLIRGAL